MTTPFIACIPKPDSYGLDWSSILCALPELQLLSAVPQDMIWHAEGDVLVHTKLVAEALVSLPEWRSLPENDRHIVFTAALLHDISKPQCTKVEGDRITSKGHAKKGAYYSRWMLTKLLGPISFETREAIVNLIRYHSSPLFVFEHDDPSYRVIWLSQMVNCKLLALLAEADVRGRICKDRNKLLEDIDLFRELCIENECYNHPRSFASGFTRYRYLVDKIGHPDIKQYDSSTCEVIMMCGLPGAGKDYWIAKNAPEMPVISLDSLRSSMRVSPTERQGRLVQEAKEQARVYLRQKKSFIWNATNTTRYLREGLITLFGSYIARVCIVYIEASSETCIRRNHSRKSPIPESVIRKLANRLDIPTLSEAHKLTIYNS